MIEYVPLMEQWALKYLIYLLRRKVWNNFKWISKNNILIFVHHFVNMHHFAQIHFSYFWGSFMFPFSQILVSFWFTNNILIFVHWFGKLYMCHFAEISFSYFWDSFMFPFFQILASFWFTNWSMSSNILIQPGHNFHSMNLATNLWKLLTSMAPSP